ncbi:DUF2897 family protein [Kangiella taiwanensis]|uniref:Uncharacterized protein n=1 Tax=Kangiella taiwanensis TaxID=1079179 RepID=A0ABP8I289_9GAMM|nr:DUF2897 family protein [Kangiella taiwanensis]
MWEAILITLLIFAIIGATLFVLKRNNKFKVPKGVKPQPYKDDEDDY